VTEWNAILESITPSVVALAIAGADGAFRTPGVAIVADHQEVKVSDRTS